METTTEKIRAYPPLVSGLCAHCEDGQNCRAARRVGSQYCYAHTVKVKRWIQASQARRRLEKLGHDISDLPREGNWTWKLSRKQKLLFFRNLAEKAKERVKNGKTPIPPKGSKRGQSFPVDDDGHGIYYHRSRTCGTVAGYRLASGGLPAKLPTKLQCDGETHYLRDMPQRFSKKSIPFKHRAYGDECTECSAASSPEAQRFERPAYYFSADECAECELESSAAWPGRELSDLQIQILRCPGGKREGILSKRVGWDIHDFRGEKNEATGRETPKGFPIPDFKDVLYYVSPNKKTVERIRRAHFRQTDGQDGLLAFTTDCSFLFSDAAWGFAVHFPRNEIEKYRTGPKTFSVPIELNRGARISNM